MNRKAHFLWVDDEIDLLRPHVLFLEEKGYSTDCVNNGRDALAVFSERNYDIVFLDENMPGLSGLETLTMMHQINPQVPVVMITQNEDEGIMDLAIGKKIADYLLKPVNPNQILLSVKKLLNKSELLLQTVSNNYRDAYSDIGEQIARSNSVEEWKNLYKMLVYWELELEKSGSPMYEMLEMQKVEANISFSRFVRANYAEWLRDRNVVLSPDVFKKYVFPLMDIGEKLFFILIDNFRLDQWDSIKPHLSSDFDYDEDVFLSILPTATPYSRNSIFSGLMPLELSRIYSDVWVSELSDEGKNNMESVLIGRMMEAAKRYETFSYHKVNDTYEGKRLVERFSEMERKDLNVIVFNFIDFFSHARTESEMLRELTGDEVSYRSVTTSWIKRSYITLLLKKVAEKGYKVIITSDHGSIRVKNPIKVKGDSETGKNVRYKFGKSLAYDPKKVFDIISPENFGLPSPNLSTRYIFAQNSDFFVYDNNRNSRLNYYLNSFQHGGISMEEMMVPIVKLTPKRN
ncbi:MAG: PglZ domain-containing protein [Fermentimonas sp.]|jgi:DNA-binding response OmpR family regulator